MNFQQIADAWVREDRAVLDTLTAAQRRAVGLIASGESVPDCDAEFVLGMKSSRLFRLRSTTGEHVTRAGVPDHVLTFVYSDERVDRAGDIVRQNFVLDDYGFQRSTSGVYARRSDGKGNPVVLWGHAKSDDMMADVPIARTIAIRQDGKRTVGDMEFASNVYPFADQVERLARAKFINAGSIGFRPLETKRDHTQEQRTEAGLGKYGVDFLRSEILEYSLCAVPCNSGALQEAVKAGAIQEKDADLFAAQSTERDWEKFVRRRARSFIDLGASGHKEENSRDGDPSESGGAQFIFDLAVSRAEQNLTPSQHYVVDTIYAMRKVIAENGAACSDLASAIKLFSEEDAASRRMLAKAITDLSARLGATRTVDSARPVADAKPLDLTPDKVAEISKYIEERLLKR